MKKKYIALIATSSIVLLLGSLIYCGISAYPELLTKPEEEAVAELKIEAAREEPVIFDYASEETPNEIYVVSGGVSSFTYKSSSEENVTYISSSKKTFTNQIAFDLEPIEEITIDFDFEEAATIRVEESRPSSYIFYEHNESNDVSSFRISTPKQMSFFANVEKAPHQAVLETSLLVVGIVDVLSLILLKKKKHKGYQY